MVLKQFQCRTHGGIFKMPARRGRPPVQCTPERPCSRAADKSDVSRVEQTASAIKNSRMEVPTVPLENGSATRAMAAKKQLEPLGWTVKGRAWLEDERTPCAEVLCTREAEFLMIVWRDGVAETQQYSLWNQTNSAKLKPRCTLPFDPVQLTDAELAEALRGMRVTWYNRISNGTEAAIVPRKLSIEHLYADGNEDPSMRIVKFCSIGGGYRAFHVGALLSIGSQ